MNIPIKRIVIENGLVLDVVLHSQKEVFLLQFVFWLTCIDILAIESSEEKRLVLQLLCLSHPSNTYDTTAVHLLLLLV